MKNSIRLALTAPVLVFAVAASAVPAQAATPAPRALAATKVAAQARIDKRLHTLATLKTAIGGAKNLSDGHRATLTSLVDSDTAGLTALRTKVDGEQSVEAVRADERSMIVDYRIYMLVVPKVRFTIASDAETAVIETLRGAHDTLANAINAAKAKGDDVAVEEAELTDLSNQIAAAGSAIQGKADGLLAVAPSADAAAMKAAVNPVRVAVRTARQDLRTAVGDARQIRRQLA